MVGSFNLSKNIFIPQDINIIKRVELIVNTENV